MAKKLLKKYFPSPETIKNTKHLSIFKKFFSNPNLWHLTRHSVATAVSIGLFIGYLPLPGHMIAAAFLAIIFQANLPIAVALVWISNPFTIPPMFYIAYRIGAHVLSTKPEPFHFETNYHWFIHEFDHFALPLLVGSLICGATLAILGNIAVRLYWRYRTATAWKKRQLSR